MEYSSQSRNRICRLCLVTCDDFEPIEDNVRDNIDILVLKINLVVSEKSVICSNCAETVKKCFDFKTTCLDTRKYIVSCTNDMGNSKIDLKNVFLCKKKLVIDNPEDHGICVFCMGLIKNSFDRPLYYEQDDNMLQIMSEKCFPELDFSIIEKPISCAACHECLERYFRFIMNSLSIEEEIRKYCETLDIKNNKIIDLTDVRQFMLKNKLTSGEDDNTASTNKEEKYCVHGEHFDDLSKCENEIVTAIEDQKFNNVHQFSLTHEKFAQEHTEIKLEKFCNSSENIVEQIKHELEPLTEIEGQKFDSALFTSKSITEEGGGNFLDIEEQKFFISEEIEIKTDQHDFNRSQEDTVQLFPAKRIQNDKSPSDAKMHQCDSCSFQTIHRSSFKEHILRHKELCEITVYKCDLCTYQTKHKRFLQRHTLVHNSQNPRYQCASCAFQTKYKLSLQRHMLVHKPLSATTMYQCDSCSFRTNYRPNLKKHALKHKQPSEITMYQCESCTYQTKRKADLKMHVIQHAYITMYRCASCAFQTKYKAYLQTHMSIHNSLLGKKVHQCDICSFQTKYKRYLKTHMLSHKQPSEITMYQCEACSFQTKSKPYLQLHMKKHASLPMYQCASCGFETKYKLYLQNHMLVHKSLSELKIQKCEVCSFQTQTETYLQRHMRIHKLPSEINMYHCENCSFKTKYKLSISKHMRSFHN